MAFNIEILSQLSVDPSKSASDINKVINSRAFRDQLSAVPIKLEAGMTQKEESSFRASVNRLVKQMSQNGSVNSVKVGVEVDSKQAVRSLNASLTEAAKNLKNIKVDIDARVDKKTLENQLKGAGSTGTASPELNTQKSITQEINKQNAAKRQSSHTSRTITDAERDRAKQAEALNALLRKNVFSAQDLVRQYDSAEDMVEAFKNRMKEAGVTADVIPNKITEIATGMQKATVEVRKYNDELRKSSSIRVTAKQDGAGMMQPQTISQRNNAEAENQRSIRAGIDLAKKQIQTYDERIQKGSHVADIYRKQKAALQDLINSERVSQSSMKEHISNQSLAISRAEQRAKATQLQTKMLHQHTKAMQQNARYIDKAGMKRLAADIQAVNLSSTNALPSLQRMQGQMQGYVNQAAQATRSQMGIMENFQNAMLKFPIWMGASTLFFGAIRSARTFISTIIEIDSKMVTLQKVMSDSTDMGQVFADAERAAERFGQTISGVMDAYAEFARQGYEGQDLAQFGDAAMVTANVGEIDVQQASEFLTASSAQWKRDAEEAMSTIDSWNEISNNYATTVEKLGEGQAKAGATAKAMGMDFDETNAIIGALTAQTKQSGSEIGNFIKSAFPRLYANTGKEVFEELGIAMENSNGETKNAITLLREAAQAMDGMSQADQADHIRGLGGVWHYQRMQVLLETLRDTNGMYDQILETSRNADGSAVAENAVYMQSLEAQINKARVAIEKFSLALGEAFLESGILNFLTEFIRGMTTLTKLFSETPAFVRNLGFGVMIATLAGANKGVRTLYNSMLGLSKLRKTMQAQTMVTATPELTKATQGMKAQAQQALILTNAQKNVTKATGIQNTAFATTSTVLSTQMTPRMTAATLAQKTYSKATRIATAVTHGLRGALVGIATMTGVGLVLGVISFGLEKFVNKSAEATDAANEFNQAQDVLKQGMEADSEQVKELADRYSDLSDKMRSGEYNNSELEEYRNVTKEMAQLFPDLVTGSEEYGQTLAGQESIIQSRIALIDQQIQKEKELAAEKQKAAQIETIEAGKSAEEDIESQLSKMAQDLSFNNKHMGTDPAFKQQIQEQIDGIKDINGALELRNQIEEYGRQLRANDPAKYEQEKFYIESMLATVDGYQTELLTTNQTVIDGVAGAGQQFMTNATNIIQKTGELDTASMNLMGSLASQVTALGLGVTETEAIFDQFESKLTADTGFQEKMASYETAVRNFQNASTPEQQFKAFQQIEAAYEQLASTISSIMSEMGIPESEINATVAGLMAEVEALYGLEGALDGTIDSEEEFVALQNAIEQEVGDATNALEEQQNAIKKLTDAFRELDGQMATIEGAMEQLNEHGFLETDTLYDLIELYPELLGQQMSAAELQDFLQQKYNETHAQKMNQYEAELMTNAEVMKGIINNENHKLHEVAKRYGIDLENYATIADAKEDVARLYNTGTVEQQNQIVDALGERYGIDLSNYGDLASKKAAIEEELMKMVTEAWNAHIEQLMALDPALNDFLKHYKGSGGIRRAESLTQHNPTGYSIDRDTHGYADKELAKAATEAETLIDMLKKIEPLKRDALTLDFGTQDIDMRKAAGASGLFEDLNLASGASDVLGDSMKGLSDGSDVLGDSLKGAGDKAKKAAQGSKDKGKADKTAGEEAEEAAEKVKKLNVEVERQIKTFTKQTFVLNKHEEALRKINLQLEKQNLQTQRYATHSANYRRALQKENKLNAEKLKVLERQERSLSNQIKSGQIKEYGMVGRDVNVAYNQYSTSTSGEGSKTAKTGKVTAASSQNQISPFAGWRTNFGYEPQGGGAYARQIGFNGGKHYGIDFGGKSGTPIITPHGGKVVKAGWSNYGGGYQVEIYNEAMDKTFTFMHMLQDLAVKTGQTVQAGTKIGRMGSTGASTATHLHFQVNTGKGLNNSRSVNPTNYLKSNANSWIGNVASTAARSTSTPNQLGKSISEETVSYLNALEQAQLAAIEQSINNHNAKEENKSKVQEAIEQRDNITLERLKLMAEMRENDYGIIESYIESYDVNKNALNHRIAELEYQADAQARKVGKTSDSAEWRKYMDRANKERERQLRFQNEQIKYIQKVLNNDAKKPASQRMNEAHRFQLEERLRDAKEQAIGLRQAIDDATEAILTSQANQIMSQLDAQLEKIDNKITLVQHKRNFLDSETEESAKKYIANLKEEAKLHDQRDNQLNRAITALKGLRKNLRQQPELYQQVTDKIKEMENAIRESELAAFNLNKEIEELQKKILEMKIDRIFKEVEKAFEKASKKFEEFTDKLHYMDKELQKDIYKDTQADILVEMEKQGKTITANIKKLKALAKEAKKHPDLYERVTDEIKRWEDQQKSLRQEMHTARKEFASQFVEDIKAIYQAQKDAAIKAIDDEMEAYEKAHNKRMKLIDKEADEERYGEDIADRQEELAKLRDEIAQRMGDDSLSNQARLKELQEELKNAEREYRRFVDDKERERRKEALQEELEDVKEGADARKENTNQVFEDLLNDQRKFNEIQEQIMKGQIDKYKDIYKELTDFVNDNVKDIGKSISEGMLDGITTSYEALEELSKLLERISEGDVKVPESGLTPIDPVTAESISELVKGISNDLSLANLGSTPSIPNLSKETVQSITNNNNHTFESMIHIDNFRGTEKEKDKFLKELETALRRNGLI